MLRRLSPLAQGQRVPCARVRRSPAAEGLALVVAMGLASPTAAWARAGRAQPVTLDVEVMLKGPDAAPLEEAIQVEAGKRLADLGHEVRAEGRARISVLVGWRDETRTAFVVTVTAQRDGEIFVQDKGICSQCGSQELFEQIGGGLEAIATEMAAKTVTAEPEPKPAAPTTADVEDTPRTKLTALGWTGVAATGTGLVVGGVGIWVWSKGEQVDPDTRNEQYLRVTDYRPPGIALTVTGGALLAGGVALIVADAVRGRRRRARPSAALVPGGLALVVGGSF